MTDKTVTLPSESEDGWAHITLDQSSWYMRFYLWLYEANPSNINTCKLFWAFVFAPLVLVLRGVLEAIASLIDLLPQRPEKTPVDYDALLTSNAEKQAKRDAKRAKVSKFERVLDAVSNALSAFYARFAGAIRFIGIAVGVVLGLAIAAAVVYLAVTYTAKFFTTLWLFAVMVGAVALGVRLLVAAEERSKSGRPLGFFRVMGKLFKSFHRHTCAKIEVK